MRALRLVCLLAATAAVVWTGLAWPPPRAILLYGLPPRERAEPRFARIEGVRFVEVPAGYHHVARFSSFHFTPDERTRGQRLLDTVRTGSSLRTGRPAMLLLPSAKTVYCEGGLRWQEVPGPIWLAVSEVGWVGDCRLRTGGWGIRPATYVETMAAWTLTPLTIRLAGRPEDWCDFPPVFSLPPGEEARIAPRLEKAD